MNKLGTPRGGFASSPLQGQQLWPGKAGSTLSPFEDSHA
jgi:hypothetical protein